MARAWWGMAQSLTGGASSAGTMWGRGGGFLAVLPLLGVLLLPESAAAHQLYVFAYAEGRVIHGEAYFRGHIPAQNLTVQVLDPAGKELGRTQTDEQGKFTFETSRQCDHRLVVKTPDGHQAEFVVKAAELSAVEAPAELAGSGAMSGGEVMSGGESSSGSEAAVASPPADEKTTGEARHAMPATATRPAETVSQPVALSARIESLQAQIGQLRQQLDEYEKTVRLRDVLGGIGYILGLAGVAFYFLGVRRNQS